MERFGDYLRKRRKAISLTQEALAAAIQVSAAYIHQLETGKIAPPTEGRSRQIAEAIGAPFSEVWGRARRERLANWANREGFPEYLITTPPGDDVTRLSDAEKALIRLIRGLDVQTLKDFNGLIVMLLRHHASKEVSANLEDFLKKCA